MVALSALLAPIVLSAVLVFIMSSLVHMVLPWHKSDYPKMANEDQVMDAMRPLAIPPGDYMVPRASSMQDMKSPEYLARMSKGPVVLMTVMPNGPATMGGQLVQWFVYSLVVSVFAGYVAGHALAPGASYLHVFRFAGATAFCCYAMAYWPMSIWYKRAWSLTIKATFDGFLFGCLTAGAFGWLWPK
jgi:hypothetical protein